MGADDLTSALTGQRVHKVLETIIEVAEQRNRRIPTREVNEVLRELAARTHPSHYRGMPVKFMYGTQAAVAPPTFVLFTSGVLEAGYLRFIERRLREEFGFEGTPISISVRVREKRKR